MHRERSRCEGKCLACVATVLKSALNITTYLAKDLPHPVTAPAEPLMSVYICMRSLHGKFCFSAYIVHSGKLVLNSVPQVDRHHQYDLQCRSAAVFTPMSTLLVIFIENIATLLYKTSHL